MEAARRADCPNCGGPIEFKLGSSAACVCPYCRFSVVRTDRDLKSLGHVADLVPTAPVMTVGDLGTLAGRGFRVGGRLQLDHGRGPWDEWYIGFDDGTWAWLAKAQGFFYVTFPVADAPVPPREELAPGHQVTLPFAGSAPLTVQERGESRLLSAEGELPFAAVPGNQGAYVDLEGASGAFVTIDYGDGQEPPQVFAGERIDQATLELTRKAPGPRPEQKVEAGRLRCPTCGAPVPIQVPDTTERAACTHCNSLLDYQNGALSFLAKLAEPAAHPLIPLGSEGVIRGEQAIVIGFMERFAEYDASRYTWAEYLLHTKNGYRWLVEDSGHFVYMRPVSASSVTSSPGSAKFRGRSYRAFQSGNATVATVLGEFYFRVEAGDRASTADFIAPPYMLSSERTEREVNWSHGEYVPGREVFRALGVEGPPPHPMGVAPCQPNPVSLRYMGAVGFALLVALGIAAFTIAAAKHEPALVQQALTVPATSRPPGGVASMGQTAQVSQTDPFEINNGPTTLEIELKTNVSNQWLGAMCALVNEETGQVREFYVMAEHWHGYSGGESWQEGDRTTTEYLGDVDSGRYSVRIQAEWGSNTASSRPPSGELTLRAGRRSSICCMGSGFLLLLPLLIATIRRGMFEARRWQHSDMADAFKEATS